MKTLLKRIVVGLLVGAAWTTGCGDDGDGGGSGAGSDCASVAAFVCAKIKECAPTGYSLTYASDDRCEQGIRQSCEASVGAPGSQTTAAQVADCIGASYTSCDVLVGGTRGVTRPAECTPRPGTLVDGAACYDDLQCQSTSCSGSSNTCGVCEPLKKAKLGEGCGSQGCEEPLVCNTKGVCAEALAAGAACGGTDDCASPFVCNKPDASGGDGVCQARGSKKPGEACTSSDDCDSSQGSFCGSGQVCTAIGIAKAGEACGFTGGGITVCEAGATCVGGATCVANVKDGESCTEDGPDCNAPADCVNGKCTLPSTPTCN